MMNLSTANDSINNSYQNINTNPNIYSQEIQNSKPQLSINPNTLNSNPFILPKSNIKYKTLSSPKSDNLKLKIIEKDKIIFEYMKKEKEYIRSTDNLKSSLQEKENEILKLKQDIADLEFKLSKKENILNQKNEQYSIITDEKQDIILNLQNENNDLNNKIINLNNIIKAYEQDKLNICEENQKNNEKISELVNQISKNENLLKIFKKNENELKEENKQIPSLKRKIADFENILKEYQNKIDELKKHNDKVINDKEELHNIINKKTAEIQKEKNNEQYIIRLNYKIDFLSNEFNEKNRENQTLFNKYSLLLKDIDIFTNIFITELNNYLNYLEGLNIYSKTLHKLPEGRFPTFETTNISQEFRGKYEIMGNVIHLIKEKIIDILNKNIEKNQNMVIDYINKENNYKLLLEEKDNILKDKNELDNTIMNTNDRIQKYKIELQKFQKDYSKLKNDLLQMQNINKDYISKNKILNRNYNDFIDDINNQLKDFPYNGKISKNNQKNKIISQINALIILNKELNNQIKNLEKENKGFKIELEQTMKDNKNLKNELFNNNKDINNKINIIKNTNESEFTNQKKLLYDKIHKLNNLLEESNQIIKAYEKETTDLKNRNLNLENNLKLLTYSHHELEKIINSSTTGLKSEIDIKDQKYNDLLKQLQLKDVHIKSLENLFNKQNKPDVGKIFTKINAIPVDINDDKNNDNNNLDGLNTTFNMNKDNNILNLEQNNDEQSFAKDEITEMKLNRLINNYEIKNKINNFYNDKSNFINQNGNNYVELKDLVQQSGGDGDLLENQNYIINEDNK